MSRRDIVKTAPLVLAAGIAGDASAQHAGLEPIIDPELPIVDPHHHFFDMPRYHYLFPDLLRDLNSGHNVVKTVFMECGSMYRADGPDAMKPVGEVEFVNGIAAMSASGHYGTCRVAAGIVGHADLRLGDKVQPVLEALIRAGGDRLRGIRDAITWDPNPLTMFGAKLGDSLKGIMTEPNFRAGMARLGPLGLSFDGWCFHPQIADFAGLADAFPNTTFILNHVASPLGIGAYAGKQDEVFAAWRGAMKDLSKRANVFVKLGGLGMETLGSPYFKKKPPATTAQLVAEWKPYLETTIEAFGPEHCMFESNFPVDRDTCSYRTLWNVFKTIAAHYTPAEKTALFSRTAERAYRLTA